MKKLAISALFLALGSVAAFADSAIVNFPSGTSIYDWNAGDTVSSGVQADSLAAVNGLTENWSYSDHIASGYSEAWDVEINGTIIGTETLTGNYSCGDICPVALDNSLTNSFTFGNIDPVGGGYTLSLVLENTVPAGGGSVNWDSTSTTTLTDTASVSETPEPTSLLLLFTGLVVLGLATRKSCIV